MGKYVKLGENTQNEYGWVVAKNDPDAYFAKKSADYKAATGKDMHSSWNSWDPQGNSAESNWNNYEKKVAERKTNERKNNYGFSGVGLRNKPVVARTADLSQPVKSQANYRSNAGEGGMAGVSGNNNGRGFSLHNNIQPRAPHKYNYDGNVSEKTLALSNPNNYIDPELQRYYDGPNANMNYRISKKNIELSGNNTSKTLGGEDLMNEVAKYYKNKNGPLAAAYGDLVAKNGNKYTFSNNGTNKDYFYTPYDMAISGNAQGKIANQELDYWNDKAFYDNGFLSEQDPGVRQLGTETTSIGYSEPSKSGGFFSNLGGLLPRLALNLIPGGQFVSAAMSASNFLDSNKPGKQSVYQGQFLEGAPQFDFGNGIVNTGSSNGNTNGGTNTTPNVQNPGTGGSQQTTQAMNKFNWNNVDYNVSGNNLYAPSGDLAYNKSNNTGSTQLGDAYNTYLGTL